LFIPVNSLEWRSPWSLPGERAKLDRRKVAVVHPRLGSGGSEARALWGVEALKRDYDVTLITGARVDLERLNRYYGTGLSLREFSIRTVRMPLGLHHSAKFDALRGAFFQRYVQRVAAEFDLMISAYNPCDFGVRGIQFVGDFAFVREWRLALHPSLQGYRRWWYGDSAHRRAYLALCRHVSKPNPEGWKRNVTVANSNWSAELLRREFGIEAKVVYPPVADDFPAVPWEEREDGFVCIGRIVPEKRMDVAIRILRKVRQDGHDVHLHILGEFDGSPFARQLKKLAYENRGWVFVEGLTYGKRKRDLLARHRYGINACENEAFGIAPAEMVKAGCIVFVPHGGGQVETVDHPALIYGSEEDAVGKIGLMFGCPATNEAVRKHLSTRAHKFSIRTFQHGFREIVGEFLESKCATSRQVSLQAKA
jgi:glycosyltransferase involved in cell wall biosynthesis